MNSELLTTNLNLLWSSFIINELSKYEVTQFYIAPGLRSAPLAKAAASHNKINIITGIDERSLAYRALGYSKASQKPSVLICTSGTAVANFLPAIIEAYKTNIPLIVISADRPVELIECGDNQTIDQTDILGKFTEKFINLQAPSKSINAISLQGIITSLIRPILSSNPRPVHLNISFRDPLDSTVESIDNNIVSDFNGRYLSTVTELNHPLFDKNLFNKFITQINSFDKVLFSFGDMCNLSLNQTDLSDLNVPFVTDILSNIKSRTLPSLDHPEVFSECLKNIPNLIVHIGKRSVSKHFYRFIKENNIPVIVISQYDNFDNPGLNTLAVYNFEINRFLSELKNNVSEIKTYEYKLNNENIAKIASQKATIINNNPLSFPLISKTLMEEQTQVDQSYFLANSTTIRSFDLYVKTSNSNEPCNKHFYGNRGASGIEGNISTAIGITDHIKKPMTIVIGDISILHDLNALSYIESSNSPICIIIANNNCGGIFGLLPIAKDIDTMNIISTSHEFNFEDVSKNFRINYNKVFNKDDLVNNYQNFLNDKKSIIIEAIIDNEKNINLYKELKTIKL